MPAAAASTGGSWNEGEKFAVIMSLILSDGGKIDWSKVYIPPGRTPKAVRHMIEGEKKKYASEVAAMTGKSEDTVSSVASTPKKPKKAAGDDTPASSPSKKRKRPGKSEEAVEPARSDRIKDELAEAANILTEPDFEV